MAPILKMASQHAKQVMLRNTIKSLPMGFAKTPLSALKHHRLQGLISTSLRHTRAYRTSTGPPNGWGYTLFDCDHDLDIVDRISREVGDLGSEDLDLMFPKDEKRVVETLNRDLHQLFQSFLIQDFRDGVVYLGALAMRLGVKIGETDMQVLRESVGLVRMYDEAREQMRAALKGYNPAGGHPWEFSCPGPVDVDEGE